MLWSRGTSALSDLSPHTWEVWHREPTCVPTWQKVQVRFALSALRILGWYRVIVLDFLSRNLCDLRLSVCCVVDQLFLQGTSGHFPQHCSEGDWHRFDFIAVSQVMGILHDESLHYLK